jgi:hypothetical protein
MDYYSNGKTLWSLEPTLETLLKIRRISCKASVLVETDQSGHTSKSSKSTECCNTLISCGVCTIANPKEGLPFKTRRLIIGFVIFVLTISFQPLGVSGSTYVRTYDIGNSELMVKMVLCSDGGLAIGGYSYFGSHREYDFILIRAEQDGDLFWIQTYGSETTEYLNGFTECDDGGFLLVGTREFGTPWILRVDSSGRALWNHTYLPENADSAELNDIIELPNWTIMAAGFQRTEGQSDSKAWVLNLNRNGTQISSMTFGNSSQSQECKSLALCQNQDIIFFGNSYGHDGTGFDVWIMRTNSTGHLIWEKNYNTVGNDHFSSGKQTLDGGFIMTGRWEASSYPPWEYRMFAIRSDPNGNLMWYKNYTGSERHIGPDEFSTPESTAGTDIVECEDNGFAIIGATNSFANFFPKNLWLVRTDVSGNLVWSNTLKRDSSDWPESIVRRDYGGFIVLATTRENMIASNYDTMLAFFSDAAPLNQTTTSALLSLDSITVLTIIAGAGIIVTLPLLYRRRRRTGSLDNATSEPV